MDEVFTSYFAELMKVFLVILRANAEHSLEHEGILFWLLWLLTEELHDTFLYWEPKTPYLLYKLYFPPKAKRGNDELKTIALML